MEFSSSQVAAYIDWAIPEFCLTPKETVSWSVMAVRKGDDMSLLGRGIIVWSVCASMSWPGNWGSNTILEFMGPRFEFYLSLLRLYYF